mmetsp:Transcript_20479/g.60460  ORF Transcript_20479/g.60460 Transcript_20479/m.60460 type:complete len:171 (+) Transcript_20479:45-557(+)
MLMSSALHDVGLLLVNLGITLLRSVAEEDDEIHIEGPTAYRRLQTVDATRGGSNSDQSGLIAGVIVGGVFFVGTIVYMRYFRQALRIEFPNSENLENMILDATLEVETLENSRRQIIEEKEGQLDDNGVKATLRLVVKERELNTLHEHLKDAHDLMNEVDLTKRENSLDA